MVILIVKAILLLILCSSVLSVRFTLPEYEREVPETFPEGGYEVPPDGFLRVLCNDEITGNQIDTVQYSISAGIHGPFELDSTNGQLSVTNGRILDYETNQSFRFTVMCTDTSNIAMNATAQVIITILPVNEFPPVLSPSALSVTVFENTPVETTLVSTQPGGLWRQYMVTDRDTGPHGDITYTLVNRTDTSNFNLDRNTGSLTLAQSLDVDNTQGGIDRVLVVISACDEDPPRADCPNLQVSVIVFSSNDNNPVFSSDQYEVRLPETSSVGTIVVTPECTDADVGAGQYQGIELALNEDGLFAIPDSRNVTVVLNGSLDFESNELYNETLVCRDTQGRSAIAYLIVRKYMPSVTTSTLPGGTTQSTSEESTSFFSTVEVILMSVAASILLLVIVVSTIVCLIFCLRYHKSDKDKTPKNDTEMTGSSINAFDNRAYQPIRDCVQQPQGVSNDYQIPNTGLKTNQTQTKTEQLQKSSRAGEEIDIGENITSNGNNNQASGGDAKLVASPSFNISKESDIDWNNEESSADWGSVDDKPKKTKRRFKK